MMDFKQDFQKLNNEYRDVSIVCECPERSADNVFKDNGSAQGTRCRCDVGVVDDAGNVESRGRFNVDKVKLVDSPRREK